jgi:AcrR family transcriptional regulator
VTQVREADRLSHPYDPEGTRRRILDSGLHLFAQRGYDGASVQEVADHAGLTKGAFYHHFASKSHLLLSLDEEYLAMVDAALGRPRHTGDPLLDVHALTVALLRAVADHRDQALLFHQERRHLTEPFFAGVAEQARVQEMRIVAALADAQAAGRVRPEVNPALATKVLLGSISFSLTWWRPDTDQGPAGLANAICAMLFRGVGQDA